MTIANLIEHLPTWLIIVACLAAIVIAIKFRVAAAFVLTGFLLLGFAQNDPASWWIAFVAGAIFFAILCGVASLFEAIGPDPNSLESGYDYAAEQARNNNNYQRREREGRF